jgi:WD40-like Beta Propeller Repeat
VTVRTASLAALATAVLAMPAAAAAPQELVVFHRMIGEREALFSVRPDGSGLRRLTPPGASEGSPAVSPDRRLIAAFGSPGIVIRTRGGRLVRGIRGGAGTSLSDLSWSPGGRWIAYLAEQCEPAEGRDIGPLCADLWLVRPDGRVRRRLVDANVYTADTGAKYAWSPSGARIVFERGQPADLAIVDVGTGAIRALPGTRRFGSEPAWTRTGWIVFARQRGPARGSDLYAVRPNGRNLHRLCRAQSAERPVSTRDGEQIAFLDYRPANEGNVWRVRVVPTDGGRCRDVGAATEEFTLRWSPDGARLLWENFGPRLVVARADGRGRPRVLARGSFGDWR